jgi:hypothetical protein
MECDVRLEERVKIHSEEIMRLSIATNDLIRHAAVSEQRLKIVDEKLGAFSYAKESIDRFLHINELQMENINKSINTLSNNTETSIRKLQEEMISMKTEIEDFKKMKYILLGGAAVLGFFASVITSILLKYI